VRYNDETKELFGTEDRIFGLWIGKIVASLTINTKIETNIWDSMYASRKLLDE